jgi:hypothetical protein
MPHVRIARVVFEDEGTRSRLGITGDRPEGFPEYVQEARRFYDTIADDDTLQQKMAERGVDAEAVSKAQESLDQLVVLN